MFGRFVRKNPKTIAEPTDPFETLSETVSTVLKYTRLYGEDVMKWPMHVIVEFVDTFAKIADGGSK